LKNITRFRSFNCKIFSCSVFLVFWYWWICL